MSMSMAAKSIGSAISVRKIRAKSTPMVTTVVSMPDFTSILSTIMIDFMIWKKASMRTEKLVLMTSLRMPKTTSSSEGNMVIAKTASSLSADVSAVVGKVGAEKPPPLCSCSRRAVARPNVNVWSLGTSSIMRRTNDWLSSVNTGARSGASSSAL